MVGIDGGTSSPLSHHLRHHHLTTVALSPPPSSPPRPLFSPPLPLSPPLRHRRCFCHHHLCHRLHCHFPGRRAFAATDRFIHRRTVAVPRIIVAAAATAIPATNTCPLPSSAVATNHCRLHRHHRLKTPRSLPTSLFVTCRCAVAILIAAALASGRSVCSACRRRRARRARPCHGCARNTATSPLPSLSGILSLPAAALPRSSPLPPSRPTPLHRVPRRGVHGARSLREAVP